MKGQYFSFDAIVATVIMVIAFTTLVAYWYGVQSTIDSRVNSQYDDALRVADSLLSPGTTNFFGSDWTSHGISAITQIGLSNGFGNQLNSTKVLAFRDMVNPGGSGTPDPVNYTMVGRLLRVTNYYILIEPINGTAQSYGIGDSNFTDAREVAVANRGATMNGTAMRMRVFVYSK